MIEVKANLTLVADLPVNSQFRVDNLFSFLTKIPPPFIYYHRQCIYNLKAAIDFANYHGPLCYVRLVIINNLGPNDVLPVIKIRLH